VRQTGAGTGAWYTAQAAEQIFKGHIAVAFDQQPHGVEDRTASAMQAMQLDHALGPVREPVRLTKKRWMPCHLLNRNKKRTWGVIAAPAQEAKQRLLSLGNKFVSQLSAVMDDKLAGKEL
jgi:hypothetical protein